MSKLSAIKAKLAAILAQLSVVKTDKAVLEYDGEDLKAGMAVYVTNEETGERVAAADGEYTTEDGKVIVVKDGMVESVTDPVAEVDGADEEPKPEDAPEGTEGATDEDATKKEEMEEEPVEEPKETEPTEIEKIREEINELYKLVDSILEKIGESRREADERLAKLEKMSAARPAEEEVELSRITPKTGDAKIDKRLERAKELGRNWRD